jgi:hypothetical protein
VDCAMAASLEGWRMRDGWREIAMNPWRRVKGAVAEAKPDTAGRTHRCRGANGNGGRSWRRRSG